MKLRISLTALLLLAASAQAAWAQDGVRNLKLCGWYENPTPGNFYLRDSKGQWTVGLQGQEGHLADGDLPEFKDSQWVAYNPNGSYGFGCACIEGSVNTQTRMVLRIDKAQARSIAACRKDRKLPEMKMPSDN